MKKLSLISAVILLVSQVSLASNSNEDCPYRKSGDRNVASDSTNEERVSDWLNGEPDTSTSGGDRTTTR